MRMHLGARNPTNVSASNTYGVGASVTRRAANSPGRVASSRVQIQATSGCVRIASARRRRRAITASARAVFFYRLGEIRDRTYEESAAPRLRPEFLGLPAIILWNTRYLERAVGALRQTEDVSDHLLVHLSPLWLGTHQSHR